MEAPFVEREGPPFNGLKGTDGLVRTGAVAFNGDPTSLAYDNIYVGMFCFLLSFGIETIISPLVSKIPSKGFISIMDTDFWVNFVTVLFNVSLLAFNRYVLLHARLGG